MSSILFYSTGKIQTLNQIGPPGSKNEGRLFGDIENFSKKSLTSGSKKLKGRTLWYFSTFLLQNVKQIEGSTLNSLKISRKTSQNAKKLKGGHFGMFQHPLYRKTIEG